MKNMICTTCGSQKAKKTTKGSFLIEIVLWCCFLVPGLIYSIWRMTSRQLACTECKSTALVPLNSPRGIQLSKEFTG